MNTWNSTRQPNFYVNNVTTPASTLVMSHAISPAAAAHKGHTLMRKNSSMNSTWNTTRDLPNFCEDNVTKCAGEKLYECKQCERVFGQKNLLTMHIRSHTGEKPHQCENCKKRFSQLGSLKRHKIIHTGLKPYRCEVCAQGFADKSNLIKHVRRHTGIPYMYQRKPRRKSSADKRNLMRHVRSRTDVKQCQHEQCKNRCCRQNAHIETQTCTAKELFQYDIFPSIYPICLRIGNTVEHHVFHGSHSENPIQGNSYKVPQNNMLMPAAIDQTESNLINNQYAVQTYVSVNSQFMLKSVTTSLLDRVGVETFQIVFTYAANTDLTTVPPRNASDDINHNVQLVIEYI